MEKITESLGPMGKRIAIERAKKSPKKEITKPIFGDAIQAIFERQKGEGRGRGGIIHTVESDQVTLNRTKEYRRLLQEQRVNRFKKGNPG